MGISKVVSIEELMRGNPRLCLSALRVFGKCFQCPQYVSGTGRPCDSRIENKEADDKMKAINAKKAELKAEIKRIEQELKEIE